MISIILFKNRKNSRHEKIEKNTILPAYFIPFI